jgi:tetratricopeptide (TPR) repeat protein
LQEFISRHETSIAWNNKGAALDDLNKSDEAIQSYNKAIEIDPTYSDAWYNSAFFILSSIIRVNQFLIEKKAI